MTDPPRHLRLVEDPAFRTFARTAVEARADVVTAVLQERIAEYLCIEWRAISLAQASSCDAAQMRGYARDLLRLVEEIRAERPPTPFEIAQVEQATALTLARARVRCQASAHQHALSGWRPDPERPGFELATCDRCQAGVSINLGQAQESLSDELLTSCAPPRRVWRPW